LYIRNFIGYITDFTCETTDAGRFLLQYLLNKLKSKKLAYLNYFGNIENPLLNRVFDIFREYRAYISDSDQYFVLRNISYPDEKLLFDIKNWYLNALWSEGYI